MTSGNYQSTNSTDHQGNGGGRGHEAAYGQRVRRWVRGRWASGRLLARRTLRRGGPALALGVVLLSGLLGQLAAAGLGKVPVVHAQGAAANSQGGANVFHPSNDHGRTPAPRHGVPTHYTPPAFSPIQRQLNVTMKPADLALTPGMAAHLLSSDGRLEVSVPAGAVTAALEQQAGGSLHLHIEELEGPSGGTDSGRVSLGTYAFTLLDASNHKLAANLAQPLTLTLHLDGWRGAAFDLNHVTLIVNGGVPLSVFADANGKVPAKMTPRYVTATLDAKAKTLTAQMPFSGSGGGGSSTGTWNTESPEAQWSKQPDTSVDLSGGDLTYSYPLDVPAGQGGLAPKLTLSYDSAAG